MCFVVWLASNIYQNRGNNTIINIGKHCFIKILNFNNDILMRFFLKYIIIKNDIKINAIVKSNNKCEINSDNIKTNSSIFWF